MLIEPNDCHSECLPSYVNYFLQAGFDVDLFISTRNYQENAFVYSDFSKNKFRIFSFDKPFSTEEFYEYLKNYNDFSIASGEYLPSKTDWSLIATDKRELKTNNGDITFHLSKKKDKYYIQFENNTGTDTYIDVPLIYYYGYRAKSINHNNYYSTNNSTSEKNRLNCFFFY